MKKFSLYEFNRFLQGLNQKTVATEHIVGVSHNCMVFQNHVDSNGNWCLKPYNNTYNIVITDQRLLFIPIYDRETTAYYEKNRIIDLENGIADRLMSMVGLPEDYMYLPYYGTLAYFKSAEDDEMLVYINRRKSHSFKTIPYATLIIHCESNDKVFELIDMIKSKHLSAYRYLDETGEHLYDYRGRLDKVYEDDSPFSSLNLK